MWRLSQKFPRKGLISINGRLLLVPVALFFFILPLHASEKNSIDQGKYLVWASGGCSCHTDTSNNGEYLAGGRPIKTPFGIFFGTNITPDSETGIGKWSDEDFIRAMTQGLSPEGKHFFPVFPYTSFSKIKKADLLAIKAYLFSLPAVSRKNKPHELIFPFGEQVAMSIWKDLGWKRQSFEYNKEKTKSWNRGAYLAEALAHCGECHTPRNLLGALKSEMHYAGSREGPEGELAPNITPDKKTGVGSWNVADMTYFLQYGMKPDGDDSQGLMGEVIEHGYQNLKENDLKALAEYIFSLPSISNDLRKTKDKTDEMDDF